MNAEHSLQLLVQGYKRFISGYTIHPHQDKDRQLSIIEKQEPIAIILGCSDSRLTPEIIFDLGLGDLFIVRVAGYILNDVVLDSIQYAIKHLNVELLIVLGHTHCGAIEAAIAKDIRFKSIIEPIIPIMESVNGSIEDITEAHIINITQKLLEVTDISVVGLLYDLDTRYLKTLVKSTVNQLNGLAVQFTEYL